VAGPAARVKWPNDVQRDGRKVAGVLVEGRPHEGWAVVGIGVNVSAAPPDVPDAGTLGRDDPEAVLGELLAALETRLAEPKDAALAALRARDALLGAEIRWDGGTGVAAGIDADGGLRVTTAGGERVLAAGEVHLRR
jgi:BirA family biotin operon repressor/biotin-[acetyl-CoA-carboxylase] ligase